MKDSQPQTKKRMFLRKKESKNAPAKVQKPQRRKRTAKEQTVVFDKEKAQNELLPSTQQEKNDNKTDDIPEENPKQEEVKQVLISQQRIETRPFFSAITTQYFTIRKRIVAILATTRRHQKDKKPLPKVEKAESVLKQFETDLQLAMVPLILLAVLATLMLINNHYLKIIADNSLPQVESVALIQPFPLAENVIPPDISAKAAIVLDADSQVILLSKNENLRFSMASTTKIMTALTALDYFEDDAVLTVKTAGVDGSVLGLQRGEQLLFKDLLYAMLLPSANDAAVVVADNYPDGREAFVEKMNEKALLLHLTNTHFADPTGLNDDGNYTTVIDLARLGSHAMKNKTFAEIVGTREKVIYNTYYSKQYVLTNLNRLLGTNGVNGIKTGTTEGAGEVLVTSTKTKGHTYIIVVMNSTDRFADTRELLDFVNEKVTYILPPLPRSN